MSLFDVFKKKEKPTDEALEKVDLAKRVNLAKEEVHKICLEKKPLNGLKARVGLVLDYSGSMSELYADGTVQRVIEQIIPLAMNFDDNGNMEVWIFENHFRRLPDVHISNLYGYVDREIISKKFPMGGTSYSPVMEDVMGTYDDSLPSYVLFITDGDNSDHSATTNIIRRASNKPIFWQFVGLGYGTFRFLKGLDDMEGRFVDNADFFAVTEADKITYRDLLNEFPGWLENEKVKAMLP